MTNNNLVFTRDPDNKHLWFVRWNIFDISPYSFLDSIGIEYTREQYIVGSNIIYSFITIPDIDDVNLFESTFTGRIKADVVVDLQKSVVGFRNMSTFNEVKK